MLNLPLFYVNHTMDDVSQTSWIRRSSSAVASVVMAWKQQEVSVVWRLARTHTHTHTHARNVVEMETEASDLWCRSDVALLRQTSRLRAVRQQC